MNSKTLKWLRTLIYTSTKGQMSKSETSCLLEWNSSLIILHFGELLNWKDSLTPYRNLILVCQTVDSIRFIKWNRQSFQSVKDSSLDLNIFILNLKFHLTLKFWRRDHQTGKVYFDFLRTQFNPIETGKISEGCHNDAMSRFLEIINIVIVVPKYPAFSTEHIIIEQKIVICQHLLLGHVSIETSQNSYDYQK